MPNRKDLDTTGIRYIDKDDVQKGGKCYLIELGRAAKGFYLLGWLV